VYQVHIQIRGPQAGQRFVKGGLDIFWGMKGVPQLGTTISMSDNGEVRVGVLTLEVNQRSCRRTLLWWIAFPTASSFYERR
jgi:hypothetical protein